MAGFKVKAVYEYTSEEPDDLSFPVGQVITITEEIDADWYEGEYTDVTGIKKTGIFPNNFVEKYEPEVPSRPSRPTRPKQDTQPALREPSPEPEPHPEPVQEEQEDVPVIPAASKPQPPPVSIPAEPPKVQDEVRSPQSAVSQKSPLAQVEPPSAPKPAPAEPAAAESKKPPPPVAPKSNAFKDRIAAFNQPAAAPVMPFQPQGQKSTFIKKPFVAPPPSSSAYVPPPTRQEPPIKPYRREEDPEIRQRQEDDRAAAEAAGFRDESQQAPQEEGDEDAPKPQSLKERIALLQKQQAEQAQRRAGGGEKKEKKTPSRKASEPVPEGEDDELERIRSPGDERQSLDVGRDRPRVPSTNSQRRPQEPMSPLPDAPQHEILSGGEEADQSNAGETTEDDAGTIGPDDSDDKPAPPRRASTAPKEQPDVGDEEVTTEDAEEEEEDSMDEETRKREELRQRMAKMSGGMGMAGMFGPPGGMPVPGKSAPKKRASTKDSDRQASGDTQSAKSPTVEEPQRMPMMPIPGMQRVQSPPSELPRRSVEKEREPESEPITGQRGPDEVPDVEDVKPEPAPRASMTEERGAPPPVPKERPLSQVAAPPVPGDHPSARSPPGPPPPESRPVPPPPPQASAAPLSPGPGSESDDEASMYTRRQSYARTPTAETPLSIRTGPPPVPGQGEASSSQPKRASYFGSEDSGPHTAPSEKRSSRVPPIPGSSPIVSSRPPPPPPPQQVPVPPSRQNTDLQASSTTDNDERGESDYEGDYDTDIASSAKHKDALKSHNRDASIDGSTIADETPVTSPIAAAPPPPVQRAVPPPPPQAAPKTRQSMDTPRAPPPAPPQRDMSTSSYGGDYDPYRYNESSKPPPPVPGAIPVHAPPIPPREAEVTKDDSSDDMYSASPPRKSIDRPPPPPPTQPEQPPAMPPMPPASQPTPPPRAPPRQSLDVQRTPNVGRRSMDQGRPASDNGQIAGDIHLDENTPWWTATEPLPPVLQNRRGVDILSESEESTTSKRGGRTTISKDIYVLYIDYSQTIITARYDPQEPENVFLEQRHESPPSKLRQDQLETYWQRFGAKIADTAASLGNSKKDSTVGDGTPFALIADLIKAQPEALLPVGNRAFGALVYANLANASVMQFDEIRAGDIVTLRNAKLEGKAGPMHQKYKQDLGAGHVAIVAEWDGTRKKVKAWEQGREKAKVRLESFRLGDLKSGEVRVWRVVGREWVGWEGSA